MSLSSLGYPLGESLLPFVAVHAMSGLGWRATWQVIGVVALFVLGPTMVWLLRGHGERHRELEARLAADRVSDREEDERAADGGASRAANRADVEWSRNRVLRDPRFYCLLPAVLAPPFIGTGVFFHQIRICEAKDWEIAVFAGAFSVYAAGSVVASLIGGSLVDRLSGRRLFGVYLVPHAIALCALASTDHSASMFLYMAGAGVTAGVASPVVGALWAEMYGVSHLGAIRSAVTGLMVFATACAPGPLGWLLERGVTIASLAWTGALACVIASFLGAFAVRRTT